MGCYIEFYLSRLPYDYDWYKTITKKQQCFGIEYWMGSKMQFNSIASKKYQVTSGKYQGIYKTLFLSGRIWKWGGVCTNVHMFVLRTY